LVIFTAFNIDKKGDIVFYVCLSSHPRFKEWIVANATSSKELYNISTFIISRVGLSQWN